MKSVNKTVRSRATLRGHAEQRKGRLYKGGFSTKHKNTRCCKNVVLEGKTVQMRRKIIKVNWGES